MCAGSPNMLSSVPLLVLALTTTLAAPAAVSDDYIIETMPQVLQKALREEGNQPMERVGPRMVPLRIEDDHLKDVLPLSSKKLGRDLDDGGKEIVPQKRAALVLDRLLVALQKALREEGKQMQYERPDRDEPRVAPLRIAEDDFNDVSSLERRGQPNSGRGRVLRCYFNAVTCF